MWKFLSHILFDEGGGDLADQAVKGVLVEFCLLSFLVAIQHKKASRFDD